MNSKNTKNRVVITGIGPLTAGGSGTEEVWESVKKCRTGITNEEYEIGGESVGNYFVHRIKDFDIDRYGLDNQMLNEMREWKDGDEIVDNYYFLATINMAIEDSGIDNRSISSDRTGIILAHENIGHDHFYLKVINDLSFLGSDSADKPKSKKEFLSLFYKKFRKTGYELQAFMPLYHIAKYFGIHGYSLFLNNACASGLYAIEAASDAIKSRKCERMIVAAVDQSNIFKQIWFNEINMLAKDGKIKPFSSDRDGFTIGDGGAALVLEDMEAATARNARIYAEYLGGAFNLEGWKVTYPDVSNDYYKKSITNAIEASGLNTSDIDLVVPHGVGTSITDRYEAMALSGIFGKNSDRPIVTAFKPYVGHTLGSAALLETAIMLLGLDDNVVPPTLNYEHSDNSLGIKVLKNMVSADDVDIAIKSACGFAGYNGACVFKRM